MEIYEILERERATVQYPQGHARGETSKNFICMWARQETLAASTGERDDAVSETRCDQYRKHSTHQHQR